MKPEIPFTLGFVFDVSLNYVLLIKKNRGPSFNIGKWNGIGGKIELGESPRGCVSREFHEEAGIYIPPEEWYCFHTETHLARLEQKLNPRLYCLTAKVSDNEFCSFKSMTDEPVRSFRVSESGVPKIPFAYEKSRAEEGVYNLNYLVCMAQTWHKNPNHRWLEG